jgi:hypothetical protein
MNLKRLRGLNEHRLKRYRERLVARMKAATAKPNAPETSDLPELGSKEDLVVASSEEHLGCNSSMQATDSATNTSSTNAFPILPGEVPSSSQDEGGSFADHYAEEVLTKVPGVGNGDGNESFVSMSSMQVNEIVEPEKVLASTKTDAKGHSPGSSSTRTTVKLEPRTTRSRDAAAGREAAEAAAEGRRPEPLSVP